MSKETMKWLNTMTKIGFTAPEYGRGKAWHYRFEDQEGEGNHYPREIPTEDVKTLLNSVQLTEGTMFTSYLTEDGSRVEAIEDRGRKTIVRPKGAFGPSDPGAILGTFKSGYKIHDYEEWLVHNVQNILDADLKIGSAGLLRGGAVAWVQIELAETIGTEQGVSFRPHLTASTSCDGSLATGYQTGAQLVVCDNTLQASRQEHGSRLAKFRHTSGSLARIVDVREALELVVAMADDFSAEVESLCQREVTHQDWNRFVDEWSKPKDEQNKRMVTRAWNKAEALRALYAHDQRVAPWAGTAFGVVQAVNTFEHHLSTVRGDVSRFERNMLREVEGQVGSLDGATVRLLDKVQQRS